MGFLSLYDQVDEIDLGGGFWVRVKRYLSDEEAGAAQRALVSPRLESKVAAADSGNADDAEVREVTTTIDQVGYHRALLFAAILEWNLTGRDDQPLPLAPAAARRASILALPAWATKKIVGKISENEKQAQDAQASFPEPGAGGADPAEGGADPAVAVAVPD